MSSSSLRRHAFYAKASKGHIIKVAIDTVSNINQRAVLNISKNGIYIRESDENDYILIDVVFKRDGFKPYKSKKTRKISINVKHCKDMIKTVKKKDSMSLFIEADDSGSKKLGIRIEPENSSTNSRVETNYLPFLSAKNAVAASQKKDLHKEKLPELHIDEHGVEHNVYGHPMVISAPDFQKAKKLVTLANTTTGAASRKITIKMQKNNYLSLFADSGLKATHLEFGELLEDPESTESSDEDESNSSGDSDESNCSEDSEEEDSSEEFEEEEIIEKKSSKTKRKNKSRDRESKSKSKSNSKSKSKSKGSKSSPTYPHVYTADFVSKLFANLMRLPGLCSQMRFYAPKIQGYPLKIQVVGEDLVEIKVFIKDMKQIAYEDSIKQKIKKTSKKRKGKVRTH